MSDIWKNLQVTPTVITNEKRKLTRNNLGMYMDIHQTQDINKETFQDFFDSKSLETYEEKTGYYLSHLLFLDTYCIDKVQKILNFAFDYVSPHQKTEKEGYNYLMCMFQRNIYCNQKDIEQVLKQAINLNVNFCNTDLEGNTLMHWIMVGNGHEQNISDFFPYFSNEFSFNVKNSSGITCPYLAYLIMNYYYYKLLTSTSKNMINKIHVKDSRFQIEIKQDYYYLPYDMKYIEKNKLLDYLFLKQHGHNIVKRLELGGIDIYPNEIFPVFKKKTLGEYRKNL